MQLSVSYVTVVGGHERNAMHLFMSAQSWDLATPVNASLNVFKGIKSWTSVS